MRVGIPKETWPGETRVAVVPAAVPGLLKAGLEVVVEAGAGTAAGFPDEMYRTQGATLLTRSELFRSSDIVLQVRATPAELSSLRSGQTVIGFADPLGAPQVDPRPRADRCHALLDGADAAHHARAKHGRALVDGDDRRV